MYVVAFSFIIYGQSSVITLLESLFGFVDGNALILYLASLWHSECFCLRNRENAACFAAQDAR